MSGQPPEPGEYIGKHIVPGSYGPMVTPDDHGRPWQAPQQPAPQQGYAQQGTPPPWELQRPGGPGVPGGPWPHGPQSSPPPWQHGQQGPRMHPPPWQHGQQGPPAPWNAHGPGTPVAPKNPVLALVCSFIVPGLGTIVNGEATKGMIILGSYMLSIVLSFSLAAILVGLAFLPVTLGIWVYGLIDAYRGAERFNTAHRLRSPW